MHKKADLRLSIRAIVILILAITMLGLGLAFIRGTFLKTTEQFAEVAGAVEEQIVEEIKSKTQKLYIRGEPEIVMKRGETKRTFYGLANILDDDNTFKMYPRCTKSIGGLTEDEISITLGVIDTEEVVAGELVILPFIITIGTDAKLDTYSCEMTITTLEPTGAPIVTETGETRTFTFSADEAPYVTRKFFIKVA